MRVHIPVRAIRDEVARDVAGWLTTNDVADRVRKKPRTVLAWMHAGKLQAAGQLPDGTWLFDPRDVMAFVRFGVSSHDAAPDARPQLAKDLEAHVNASMDRARRRRRAM